MSLRGGRKFGSLMVLLIPAVLVFLLVRLTVANPPTSDSAPDLSLSGDATSAMNLSEPARASASAGVMMTAAMSTTLAPLVPAATPTPPPNNYIWVPWRSQFDGTTYAAGNCGPASLGMAMAYFGEWWSTSGIRKSTNEIMGAVSYDEGTDWPSLKYAAEKRGFKVVGLYESSGGYREWTMDELVREMEQGHPALLLVRQRSLPGHTGSSYDGEHYIVFLGLMADGRVVYHDSAFNDEIEGSYKIMSQETLMKAWVDTSVGLRYTAMSLVWEHEGRKWDESPVTQPTPQAGR